MDITGVIGAINQTAVKSDKAKVESSNPSFSFINTAAAVSKALAGQIAVASGANVETPEFMKEKFGFEIELPDKIETVYDFIAEIENLLKKSKK